MRGLRCQRVWARPLIWVSAPGPCTSRRAGLRSQRTVDASDGLRAEPDRPGVPLADAVQQTEQGHRILTAGYGQQQA